MLFHFRRKKRLTTGLNQTLRKKIKLTRRELKVNVKSWIHVEVFWMHENRRDLMFSVVASRNPRAILLGTPSQHAYPSCFFARGSLQANQRRLGVLRDTSSFDLFCVQVTVTQAARLLEEFYPEHVISRLSKSEQDFWEDRHLEPNDWQGLFPQPKLNSLV